MISIVNKLHKSSNQLTCRMCQKIKRVRAQLKPSEVKDYFQRLTISLKGEPLKNIINYDETNLADDPGSKKLCLTMVFEYIFESESYEEAIKTMGDLYDKPKNEIFTRHLITYKKKSGQTLDQFLQKPKSLAKDCSYKDAKAQQIRDEAI